MSTKTVGGVSFQQKDENNLPFSLAPELLEDSKSYTIKKFQLQKSKKPN